VDATVATGLPPPERAAADSRRAAQQKRAQNQQEPKLRQEGLIRAGRARRIAPRVPRALLRLLRRPWALCGCAPGDKTAAAATPKAAERQRARRRPGSIRILGAPRQGRPDCG
jgi:hypothetical protein